MFEDSIDVETEAEPDDIIIVHMDIREPLSMLKWVWRRLAPISHANNPHFYPQITCWAKDRSVPELLHVLAAGRAGGESICGVIKCLPKPPLSCSWNRTRISWTNASREKAWSRSTCRYKLFASALTSPTSWSPRRPHWLPWPRRWWASSRRRKRPARRVPPAKAPSKPHSSACTRKTPKRNPSRARMSSQSWIGSWTASLSENKYAWRYPRRPTNGHTHTWRTGWSGPSSSSN